MNVPIQEWYDAWLTEHKGTNLTYVRPASPQLDLQLDQVHFVRDTLARVFWEGVDYDSIPLAPPPRNDCQDTVRIVGEHRSKSVRLPVFQLSRGDIGLIMVLRYNFHYWNASVVSNRPISRATVEGYVSDRGTECFFQGFPPSVQFGTHSADPSNFSLALYDSYELYAFTRGLLREVRA